VETTRLFLHVLAATVWVGGQLVLAAAVPALRAVSAEAPRAAARAYSRVAWPAFAVLLATGIWNLVAEEDVEQAVLGSKLLLVAISGVAAFVHQRAGTTRLRAVSGALSLLGALGALLLGIVLAG
jgi:putative copper export protein